MYVYEIQLILAYTEKFQVILWQHYIVIMLDS